MTVRALSSRAYLVHLPAAMRKATAMLIWWCVLRSKKGCLIFFALQDALEDSFGRPVDLATERALDPRLKESILKELRPIYGER